MSDEDLRQMTDWRLASVRAVAGVLENHDSPQDRALDRLDRALVVGLDGEQTRLRRGHGRQLLERRRGAVVVDLDAVQVNGRAERGLKKGCQRGLNICEPHRYEPCSGNSKGRH